MARLRRYKPPGYRDGGRVPLSTATVESEQATGGVADVTAPQLPADDHIAQVLEDQLRAEALHRQAAQQPQQQPMSVEQYVDSLPNLSDHKRSFLKSNPEMLNNDQREVMAQAYAEAMQAGFQDDTPELDRWLVETVRSEMGVRRARLADAARSAVSTMTQPRQPEQSVDRAVERLNLDAASYMATEHALDATPAALAEQLPPPPAPTPRAPRGTPMTAPVSRDAPMLSGNRQAASQQVTLSAEERFIARHSFSDPNMSDEAKERLYAQQKGRLAQLRRDGYYPQSGQG